MSEDSSKTPSSMQDRSDPEPQPYTDTPLQYAETLSPPSHEPPASSAEQADPLAPTPLTGEASLEAAYQLGEVLKRYKREPTAFTTDGLPSVPYTHGRTGMDSMAWRIGPIIILLTLVIWFLFRTPPWPLILICLLILAPWLSNVISRLPADIMAGLQNTEFDLCANGLMIIRWTRVQAIRWEQIHAIQRIITRNLLRYSYILYLEEGKQVTLDSSLVGPELMDLGKAIEREVSQRLLPEAITAYEAGQALNFGPLQVSAQGLKLENEQQCLPWDRFAGVENYKGYLLTIKEGETASTWQEIEVADMLNLCVFLPLIHHIDNGLRANVPKSDEENFASYQSLVSPSEWSVYE